MTRLPVSVVMAVRNEERYVAAAVESILAQTLDEFEFIVVDDGSRDRTVDIVRSYDDPRIKIVPAPGDGLAAALNRGVAHSRGAFIARMDGDDLSHPCRLATQIGVMEDHPRMGLLGSWWSLIDEDGTFLSHRRAPVEDTDLRAVLETRNPFTHGTALVRRSAFDAVGGYRTEFRASQDLDLWLRISERWEIANVPKDLYSLRLRRGSVGSRGRMRQRAYGRAARECARQRSRGEPERLPDFEEQKARQRSRFRARLLAGSTYYAGRANAFLPDRPLPALGSALRALLWAPWNVVAWAALARVAGRPLAIAGRRRRQNS